MINITAEKSQYVPEGDYCTGCRSLIKGDWEDTKCQIFECSLQEDIKENPDRTTWYQYKKCSKCRKALEKKIEQEKRQFEEQKKIEEVVEKWMLKHLRSLVIPETKINTQDYRIQGWQTPIVSSIDFNTVKQEFGPEVRDFLIEVWHKLIKNSWTGQT